MRQRGLALGLLAGMCVVGAGACQRNPATEYVAGFSTQVQVPREFQSLEVGVFAANSAADAMGVADCVHVPVVNGVARLPKTLGVHRKTDATNVMVSVIGFRDPIDVVTQRHPDCTYVPTKEENDKANGLNARILRRSRQNYRDGKVLYLPMPLKYACFDVDCDKPGDLQGDQTCVAGKCISAKRHELVFREYSPDLAFGDSSACFSQQRCMSDAVEPKLEDADKCIYSVPGTGDGMNVRVIYDGFIPEMLDLDNVTPPGFDSLSPEDQKAVKDDLAANQEGFTLLGPGKFQLAPGLCELSKPTSKGKHRIVAIAASRACGPKAGAQPLCDEGSEVLIPAASRVLVLLDRSATMQPLLGKKAIDQALQISLTDPVFTTTKVAFKWLPGSDGNTCQTPASYSNLDLPYDGALATRDKLVDKISAQASLPAVATASVDSALKPDGAYAALRSPPAAAQTPPVVDANKLNRLATVIVTNSDMSLSCTGSDAAAAINAQINDAANTTSAKRVKTYVIELGVVGHKPDGDPVRVKNQAALAAMGAAGAATYDATSGDLQDPNDPASGVVAQAMSDLIRDMSSCLYEKPENLTDTGNLKVATNTSPQEIPFNTSCTEANADNPSVDGWNLDGNGALIRICGQSCTNIRNTLQALSANSSARRAAMYTGTAVDPSVKDLPPAMFVTATIKNKP